MSADDGIVMDLGGVYERCKYLARQAVMESPRSSFGLEDVMPESRWLAFLSSGLGSLALQGMLSGCVEAMAARSTTALHVHDVAVEPSRGMSVGREDLKVARGLLVAGAAPGLDDAARQELVDAEIRERGWKLDASHLASVMIAVVIIAGAAVDH